MKRIIIHCGLPKTGTSALQTRFAQSYDTLLDSGIAYLRMGDFDLARKGQIGSGNGVGLARAYLPPSHEASMAARRGELTDKFQAAIADAEGDVVLSSEFFGAIPVALLGELASKLGTLGKVVLVYFVREQVNFLTSAYIQRVKRHGEQRYPDEFFADWDAFKPSLRYHDYLSSVREACPDVEIAARAYELARDFENGLFGLFLEMVGAEVPADRIAEDLPVNLSPSPVEIRLLIELNKHAPRMRFSDMVVEASVRADRARIHAGHTILPPALRQEIRTYFRQDNQRFFEEIARQENIYDSSVSDEDYVDLRQVQIETTELVDIVGGILVHLDNRIARLEQ